MVRLYEIKCFVFLHQSIICSSYPLFSIAFTLRLCLFLPSSPSVNSSDILWKTLCRLFDCWVLCTLFCNYWNNLQCFPFVYNTNTCSYVFLLPFHLPSLRSWFSLPFLHYVFLSSLSSFPFSLSSSPPFQVIMCSSAGVTRPSWSENKKLRYPGSADIPIVRLNPFNILNIKKDGKIIWD